MKLPFDDEPHRSANQNFFRAGFMHGLSDRLLSHASNARFDSNRNAYGSGYRFGFMTGTDIRLISAGDNL